MKKFFLIISLMLFVAIAQMRAQDISPMAEATTVKGDVEYYSSEVPFAGSAPLKVHFTSGSEDHDGYFEWRFYKNKIEEGQQYLVRHEEETEFTFTEAGSHLVCLYASFPNGDEKISDPITINISTSKLEFPNAFSPNGDGYNDTYKAKDGYQSIVEFKATIYNRWGQKLHEWTDPAGSWDGTFHGKDVKQGVYYVHVQAKGADGVKYNIKKDVNLLRGYTDTTSNEKY
jgi:gliding motility-associated-like protein